LLEVWYASNSEKLKFFMNLVSIFSKFGVAPGLVQDATLLLVIIFTSFVFSMLIGRYKLITILINIYVSLAVLAAVPAGYLTDYTYQLYFFFGLVIVLTLASKKLFEIYISGSGSGFLWRVFAMSFLEVVLFLSVALSIMPEKTALGYVSKISYGYLASPNAQFIWIIAPLIFILAIHKKMNR